MIQVIVHFHSLFMYDVLLYRTTYASICLEITSTSCAAAHLCYKPCKREKALLETIFIIKIIYQNLLNILLLTFHQ